MKMQFSKKEILDAIVKTVKFSGLKECYVRPLAYYGYGMMGLTPTQNKVDVSIACWAWKMGESKAGKFSGAKCKVSSWIKIDSRFIDRHAIENNIRLLSIQPHHIFSIEKLPFHHRDPFDGLLLSQCLQEKMHLLSKDKEFDKYGINRIW